MSPYEIINYVKVLSRSEITKADITVYIGDSLISN